MNRNLDARIFHIEKVKKWIEKDDNLLFHLVNPYGRNNWNSISKIINKNAKDCYKRYHSKRKDIQRGFWKEDEDLKILELYNKYGPHWSQISREMGTRTGKQIRDRFLNRIDTKILKTKFTIEEDLKILKLQKKYGNKWTFISKFLPGRSSDNIKIRFYSCIKNNEKILLFIERRDFAKKNPFVVIHNI